MTDSSLLDSLARVAPVIAFLLAITVVAELSDRAGVFDVAGHWLARHGGRRMLRLWLLFSGLAIACTIVLSLDTTAVLLTPVALAIARQIGAAPRPFALTTLWIANTGSLLLPVSNLTNLLALHRFEAMGVDHAGYVRLAVAPALASIVATLLVIAALHRAPLARGYVVDPPADPHDPVMLRLAGAVCLLVGPAFAAGLPPWAVAGVAALVLGVASAVRAPAMLRGLPIPWAMAAGFAALTVVVTAAHDGGYLQWLIDLAGRGEAPGELLRVAAATALGSNAVNNLPAYLALEPAAHGDPRRLMAILLGANAGPLVTPWASLATLLWLQRCRAAGVRWRLWRLALGGFLCAAASVTAAVLTLAFV